MKNVIITGANGFIGSNLINKLLSENVKVTAIDLPGCFHNIPKGVTFIESDFSDLTELLNQIKGDFDAFYHFAWKGVNGADKGAPYIQLNNLNVLLDATNLAKKLGCRKFLCAGTVAEHSLKSLCNLNKSNPAIMYGTFKHCANLILETVCKTIDLDFVWMQFSNVYGSTNKTGNILSYTISQINNNLPASFGPADSMYDFIYIDDLIEAIYRLGNNRTTKNFYFVGSGTPRLLKDYLFEIGKIFNKLDLIKIGERASDGVVYTEDMFDSSELIKEIGSYVKTSFNEGIKKII